MLSQTIDQQLFWSVKKAPKTILQLYALLIEKIPKKCDIDLEQMNVTSFILQEETSQELRMLSPSFSVQRSQCNCPYCCFLIVKNVTNVPSVMF